MPEYYVCYWDPGFFSWVKVATVNQPWKGNRIASEKARDTPEGKEARWAVLSESLRVVSEIVVKN